MAAIHRKVSGKPVCAPHRIRLTHALNSEIYLQLLYSLAERVHCKI